MSPQEKKAASLAPVHTAFDLALGLSMAVQEAESVPEEDFGEDAEGSCIGGEPDAANLGNAGREGARMRGSTCRVGEPRKVPKDTQNPPTANGGSLTAGHGTRKKRNEARRLRRNKKRKCDAEEQGREDGGVKGIALKRRREMADTEALTSTDAQGEDLKAAEGGWLGSLKNTFSREESDLQRVLDRGFKLVKWDGRSPHAILDRSQRVVAVLAGMAKGGFEDDVVAKATAAFKVESEALPPPGSGYVRGKFHAVFAGISHGGGTPEPMQTATESIYRSTAERLRGNEAVARLAGFQNQVFQTYFPLTHAYYRRSMEALRQRKKRLIFPFVDSLPSAAFNLGPSTVCTPHRDAKNLSFGICCITALGSFDPTAGGHLVLEELQLVVEFPPGSTVLIPSAVVTHSNTRIKEGERRYSFTQYASGSLFSYVENGMRTTRDVMLTLSSEQKAQWKREGCERWNKGLMMFPFIWDYTSPVL